MRWSAISSAASTPAAGGRAIRARCPTNPRRRSGTGERPNLFNAGRKAREPQMLKWAFVFLLIAIVAGIFGFTDVEAASATIAQWLFGIFLFLFLGALAIGLFIGAKLFS